ncbi:ArsR/SmtB family transcription factor [Kitasatospora sp. NPDC088391]|uniref:ArsR/SmtB family transcription factor n=1 Tax=Kitasatospora sp. NPDC088391 TaxID=3364074 RepID=UPI00380811C3
MLRIHFTVDDLANTRVATAPDLAMETVLSLRVLDSGANDLRFRQWRRTFLRHRDPHTLLLGELCTPTVLPAFLEDHIRPDARATAASAAGPDLAYRRAYIEFLAKFRPLTPFARHLADEDPRARALFGRALGGYQATAIDPFRAQIRALFAADRAHGAPGPGDGLRQLFDSLHPGVRWNSPVLEVDVARRDDLDLHLGGRGLLIQPTVFGTAHPLVVGYNTPDERPSLCYPIRSRALLGVHDTESVDHLVPLLGRTRTAVLTAIAERDLHSTGELARHIGCTPAAISQHTAVLRDSALLRTHRTGRSVRHVLTDLAVALLGANP